MLAKIVHRRTTMAQVITTLTTNYFRAQNVEVEQGPEKVGEREREERVREEERGIRGGKGNTVETERNKVPKYLRKGRETEGRWWQREKVGSSMLSILNVALGKVRKSF